MGSPIPMPKRKSASSQARRQSVAQPTSAKSAEPTPTAAENQPLSTDEQELEIAGYVEWRLEEDRKEVDSKLSELDYRLFKLEHTNSSEFDDLFEKDCFVPHEPVAEFLGTSVQGVRRLMMDGLPHHRLSERVTRFRKSEIIAWVQSRP